MKPQKYSRGLSLIELIIVMGVAALITVISIKSMVQYSEVQAVDVDAQKIKTALERTRFDSVYSKNSLSYGVKFLTDKMIVFQGTTFSSSSPSNLTIAMDDKTFISKVTLSGGGSTVTFSRLTGETTKPGSITVSSKNKLDVVKVINIFKTGNVSI